MVAGGSKYICQSILFKFALDVKMEGDYWIYGGKHGSNNEKAMKSANHELKVNISFTKSIC